ncbi:hypothetical protein [Moraxella lacunata]
MACQTCQIWGKLPFTPINTPIIMTAFVLSHPKPCPNRCMVRRLF